ncbi:death-associated protein kinase dapk-1-like isoform X2 [Oscarella lobularis]|uniref:death-associated protein kinase dapk-1-like isoform X2 n=1 Tax=Oscarella lobularis TaxID=121494 RepID=UPI003313242B
MLMSIASTRGKTPFMLACQSSIDRSLKVRYLDEKGADCQAKDHEGMTALFYATWHANCEDDEVKDVLHCLVTEKNIDIYSVNEKGMTPLLFACDHPSFIIIQELIELGADVSARDKNKQNALHIAAKCLSKVDKSIIDLLIRKGVDVTCQDKDGKTPYEVANDGETRALLRQHYDAARFSVLQREMVRPDSIKFCVIGSEMAGKTTFVISLLQLNRLLPKEEDRTPGVEIHNCQIPGVGKGSAWDFGAQPTFHSAHGLFFQKSNTMFCLILPIREGEKMTSESVLHLLERGRFWCAFSKAALRTLPPHLTSLIRLVVIFNLICFNEEVGINVSVKLEEVVEILRKEFEDTFKISHVIKMDCSKSQSECMNGCRKILKQIREEMLKEANDVPKLCYAIEEYLSLSNEKRKSPLAYFLTADEFVKWVAEEVGIKLAEDEKKVAVEYLDSSGIIINLGRRICVRPLWLCHNVIGPLLAPPNFVFGMPRENSGKASIKDMESALRLFENYLTKKGTPSPFVVTVDEAIEVLLELDLCIPVKDMPGVYQINALLNDKVPADAWGEHLTMDVYRGQRYECLRSVDIISPSSFAVFQSRCSRLPNTSYEAWKDGVKLVRIVDDKKVESLIEYGIKKEHCCIDIILRWSSKSAGHEVAKQFLDELKSMIATACDERSPGVILNWFYLDSSHLRRLDEDPAIYSYSEVDKKLNDRALNHILFSTRPEKRNDCRVRDLVIIEVEEDSSKPMVISASPIEARVNTDSFPSDDELVPDDLMRTCAATKASKWEDIGVLLGISSDDIDEIRDSTRSKVSRMFKVLESWSKKAENAPTVGKLLARFKQVGVSRRAINTKFEELYGRK